MENDANCAAMAEKLSGNAVKLDDFALITIDSGVGGALFLDGRIRRGKDWRAGDLGMMIPNYETGGFHTMQDYLSTIVLAEEYAKEFDVPTGSIVPATLFHRLDEPRVRKIVDRWIDYLAIGIFNIVAVADPECVLLGGGICREQQLLPAGQCGARQDPAVERFPHGCQALPAHQQRRSDRSLLRLRNRGRRHGEGADPLVADASDTKIGGSASRERPRRWRICTRAVGGRYRSSAVMLC